MLTHNLNQDVTLWISQGIGATRDETFASPVKIEGRWEERPELFISPNGEEEQAENIVFLDRSVEIGDYIALGDQTAQSDPLQIAAAIRVRAKRTTPNLRGTEFEYRVLG